MMKTANDMRISNDISLAILVERWLAKQKRGRSNNPPKCRLPFTLKKNSCELIKMLETAFYAL